MNNTTPPTTDSPELKPLQFTLRSMFVVTIALAVLLGLTMQFGYPVMLMLGVLACIAIAIYKRDWQYVVVAFIIAMLAGLLIPAVPGVRPPGRRVTCLNNIKQISLALLNYHACYGSFPPAYVADADGKPMHSWRVFLLPFIDRNDLFEQYRFDEPWDGPNNRKLHNVTLNIFRCPSETSTNTNMTNYVAVVGPGTAWPGTKSTKLADFSDGTGNTLLIVEVADSGIHWMEPRDLHVLQMNPNINGKPGQGISSNHSGGAIVAFADGSAYFLSDDLPPETIKALLTIDGGEEVSPEDWE